MVDASARRCFCWRGGGAGEGVAMLRATTSHRILPPHYMVGKFDQPSLKSVRSTVAPPDRARREPTAVYMTHHIRASRTCVSIQSSAISPSHCIMLHNGNICGMYLPVISTVPQTLYNRPLQTPMLAKGGGCIKVDPTNKCQKESIARAPLSPPHLPSLSISLWPLSTTEGNIVSTVTNPCLHEPRPSHQRKAYCLVPLRIA